MASGGVLPAHQSFTVFSLLCSGTSESHSLSESEASLQDGRVVWRWPELVATNGSQGWQLKSVIIHQRLYFHHEEILGGFFDHQNSTYLTPLVQSSWGFQLESSVGIVDALSAVTSCAFCVSHTLMKPLVLPVTVIIIIIIYNLV